MFRRASSDQIHDGTRPRVPEGIRNARDRMTRMLYPEASSAPAAQTQTRNRERAVAAWLLVCCALVFAMVVVGGVTRLTHSGLSIVEWQPIVGALPPLDEAGWQETFGKYKQTPEYRHVNPGMNLEGFKGIFWWEYVHRLLGRLIGAAFLLPLLWFALRGGIARALAWKFAVIFGLGAGTRAGLAYNTFPLMNGRLVPPEIFAIEPWYLNFSSNMATVQFDHRLIAWLLALLVPWFWLRVHRAALPRRAKLSAHLLLGALALQIALGIATLLLAVPIPLAAAHQAGALLVFSAALFAAHSLR